MYTDEVEAARGGVHRGEPRLVWVLLLPASVLGEPGLSRLDHDLARSLQAYRPNWLIRPSREPGQGTRHVSRILIIDEHRQDATRARLGQHGEHQIAFHPTGLVELEELVAAEATLLCFSFAICLFSTDRALDLHVFDQLLEILAGLDLEVASPT